MAEEEELELDVNPPKSSKMTTILLIVLIVLVLVMGGVGAWLFLSDDDGGGTTTEAKDKEEIVLDPIIYLRLVPEFIVNFAPGSKVRYLQVDLQISTRDESVLKTVSTYRPILRNDILVLLSGVSFDELKSRSGKEALQKKLLNTINKVVVSVGQAVSTEEESAESTNDTSTKNTTEDEIIKGPIENVYFTHFIMQ